MSCDSPREYHNIHSLIHRSGSHSWRSSSNTEIFSCSQHVIKLNIRKINFSQTPQILHIRFIPRILVIKVSSSCHSAKLSASSSRAREENFFLFGFSSPSSSFAHFAHDGVLCCLSYNLHPPLSLVVNLCFRNEQTSDFFSTQTRAQTQTRPKNALQSFE